MAYNTPSIYRLEPISVSDEPKPPVFIDRDPEHRPSDNRSICQALGDYNVRWVLEVRGLGVIVMRGNHNTEEHGVSIFTEEEILFE